MAHMPLLIGADGQGLSKRLGSLSAEQLRNEGYEPMALLSLLSKIGTSDPVDPALDVDALAASFDLSRFGRAPARFDEADLHRVRTERAERLGDDAAAIDDEALLGERLLDVAGRDRAVELVALADRPRDRELEVLELAGQIGRLALGLGRLRLGDALGVLDAGDVALRRRHGEAAGQEVVAGEARTNLDELAALAQALEVLGQDDVDVGSHDAALLFLAVRPTA